MTIKACFSFATPAPIITSPASIVGKIEIRDTRKTAYIVFTILAISYGTFTGNINDQIIILFSLDEERIIPRKISWNQTKRRGIE